jgi:hypothetical protein
MPTALSCFWLLAADQNKDAETAGVVQWEFCLLKVRANQPTSETGRQILKAGREGWELVSVENFSVDGTTTETAHYFKRRL